MRLPEPLELGIEHPAWREPQKQLFAAALSPDCPHWLFLQAPPGTGKSAFAVGLARLTGLKTLILTRTHTLMHQYRDMYGVTALKGRANFPCVLPATNVSAAEAPCTDTFPPYLCPSFDECPYYVHKKAAIASPICVTSYAYFLTAATFDATLGEHFKLLICDEGHNLIGDLSRFDSVTVPKELSLSMPLSTAEIPAWAGGLLEALPEPKPQDNSLGALRLRSKRRCLQRLKRLDPQAVYIRFPGDEGATHLSALWPTRVCARHFDRFPKVAVMSATLHPGGVIPRVMGVSDWQQHEVKSTFPPARRPFYYWPQGKLGHDRDNRTALKGIASAVAEIAHRHREHKGLIHVSSLWQAAQLALHLNGYGLTVVTHAASSPGERAEMLERFLALPAPAWLISPSMYEGQDFADDAARVQVIAKTLYLDLSDPVTKARAGDDGRTGKDWYKAEAVNRVTQAYGRVMRSDDDWGFSYGLDGTLIYLTKGRVRLPEYVMEAWTRVQSA